MLLFVFHSSHILKGKPTNHEKDIHLLETNAKLQSFAN